MKVYEAGMFVIVVLILFGVMGALSYNILDTPHHCGEEEHEGHDNVVEIICEEVIESITGIEIDLSPEGCDYDSTENRKMDCSCKGGK